MPNLYMTDQQYDQAYFASMRGAPALYNYFLSLLPDAGGTRLRVLDVGCGRGELLSALLDHPSVASVVGIDVAEAALATCRQSLAQRAAADRWDLIHASITDDRCCPSESID